MGMRLLWWFVGASFLTVLVFLALEGKDISEPRDSNEYSPVVNVEKRIRISFEIFNGFGVPSRDVTFWTDFPVTISQLQSVELNLQRQDQYQFIDRSTHRLNLGIGRLPPYTRKRVDIEVVALLEAFSTTKKALPDEISDSHLTDEPYLSIENSEIQKLAKTIFEKHPENPSQAVFQWAKNNIKSTQYRLEPVSAATVLEKREGS